MGSKVVVIISTGEKEKAMTGLMYARNSKERGWMEEVKVIFFGPSENLLVKDEDIQEMAMQIGQDEKPVACKFLSDRDGISENIESLGVDVEYVGTIISDLIKDGYIPMVF
jgi:hypothetical protein